MKNSRKTSTNFYKSNKNKKNGMRMTFYKTDIQKMPDEGNFDFRVKGLPSIQNKPFNP